MKELNEANAVLSDIEKRAAYDQLGQNYRPGEEFQPPPNWDAGFEFSGANNADFSDLFSQLFGRMGTSEKRSNRGDARGFHSRGEDHHAKIMLNLEDAFLGATKQISLRAPHADAQGRVGLETHTLNVKIPKGVYEGQIMRLVGKGSPGVGGGKPGDLLLELHFNPHPRFRVDGCNLFVKLPVTPWEAALGAIIPVNLFENELKVRIPEGTQSGQQLRLRGKGIPSKTPGDLLLDVQVVLPSAATPKAREFYESMARELAFDPRANNRT